MRLNRCKLKMRRSETGAGMAGLSSDTVLACLAPPLITSWKLAEPVGLGAPRQRHPHFQKGSAETKKRIKYRVYLGRAFWGMWATSSRRSVAVSRVDLSSYRASIRDRPGLKR